MAYMIDFLSGHLLPFNKQLRINGGQFVIK